MPFATKTNVRRLATVLALTGGALLALPAPSQTTARAALTGEPAQIKKLLEQKLEDERVKRQQEIADAVITAEENGRA